MKADDQTVTGNQFAANGAAVTLSFTDVSSSSTIHIKKVISNYSDVPSDITKSFTMNWTGTSSTASTTMTVGASGNVSMSNVKTVSFSDSAAKSISVTEVLPTLTNGGSYAVQSVTYSKESFTGQQTTGSNGGNISVSPGDNVYITVTNVYKPDTAVIQVRKVILNYSDYGNKLASQACGLS